MKSSEVRQKYLEFFKERGHEVISSSSLVPQDDPSTLFTSAGMQPILPYLLGKEHPQGKKLVDSQKCFRANDIEEVGDNRHDTFFEMLGNWSFGDYWKKEQIGWIWQFLTEELKLDKEKLYVTVFKGNDLIPKDEESFEIWKNLGIKESHIIFYGDDKNWWSRAGTPAQMPTGEPGGPSSEIFYDFFGFEPVDHEKRFGEKCHPNCDCGRFIEIGNNVFMLYQKQADGSFKELPQKNVDFGGGLERLVAATEDEADIFKSDLFYPLIRGVENATNCTELYGGSDKKDSYRIIADHVKAATFLIKDGVTPSNKLQGYILRRLLRRAAVRLELIKENSFESLSSLVDIVINIYSDTDYFKEGDSAWIKEIIDEEVTKFRRTLQAGLKEIEKVENINGKTAFDLYQSYGFPFELLQELFLEKGQKINKQEFDEEFKKHQELSKQS